MPESLDERERCMRIHREGVALGYEDAGRGDPPFLLVHGWGTHRAVMKRLFDDARRSRRVVTVDLRGFGESDAPRQAYTVPGYADDLAFVAARLGLARPVVVGHSMGGVIALELAARHADRISGAVMLEAMVVAEPQLAGLRPILEGIRMPGYRNVVARLMTALAGPLDPVEREGLATFAASCAQHVLVSALEGILSFDSAKAAARVKCPLFYIGTNVTYADLVQLRVLCPQLVTGRLVGCGHYFPLEAPDQVNAMIARFVQSNIVPRPR